VKNADRQDNALNRRELLGTVGGALLGGGALAGAALGETGAAAPAAGPAAPKPFELEELTIRDLAAGLAEGRWSSQRLVELYVARIVEVDRVGIGGTGTNAIAETNPQALEIAEGLDRERKAGKVRGPLHGIPVVLKDNIDTGDRMKTSAGSLALAQSVAAKDAYLVERLRAAGAVVLAKTNLSEWANFRSTRSTSGWSGRGGQVRNPYALDRNPCGSSSGTGAGVSANLAAAGIGTETDGSILCPSSMCGLVGLKPTVGLVSRRGIIPISSTQDTAGPMCRTVADAAILLQAIAGSDLLDPATAASAGKVSDYAKALDANGLAGARLGVVRKFFGWHPEVDRQMAAVLDLLRQLGAVLVDPVEIPHLGRLRRERVRDHALRVQARPERLSRGAARRRERTAHAGRAHRVEPAARRGRCPGSARRSSSWRRPRGRSPTRPTARRSRPISGCRAPRVSTQRSRRTSSTPWSRRRWARRTSPTG
jgi:amidase